VCASGSGDTGTKVSPGASSGTVKSFKIGDAIKTGDVVFTVQDVQSSADADFETPKSGQYLIVKVLLQNNGKSAATVSSVISDARLDVTSTPTRGTH
jgi:hypothetical protein